MRAYYIKKSANSFVKEHRISSGTINSLKSLTDIAEKESYKVYRFVSEKDRVIRALNAEDFCRTNIAFSLFQEDMRYIFIKSDVPDKAAAKLLLHELAHIRLHHLDRCQATASENENDADVFVNYVRTNVYDNVRQTHRLAATIIMCLAIMATVYAVHLLNVKNSEYSEYSISVPIVNDVSVYDTSTVYVTDTGGKYHKQDCYHLKNRRITALDINIAESLGKEPCKDCYG